MAAVQLFLRDTASDLGGAGQKALSTTRGSSSVNAITTTTVSGTNIQVTTTAGGQALTWFSGPLLAQTITGTVDVNIRGRESATTVNAGAGILIERTNSSGVVQSTILSDRTVPGTITEYTTSDAAKTSTALAITSTTFSANDRIKVTLKVRNVGTMAAGTTTNTYDGPTANASGDSYVSFSDLATVQNAAAALTAQSSLTISFPKTPPTEPDAAQLAEGTGTRAFASVTTAAGDWVIVQAGVEDNSAVSGLTPTATGLTFTVQNDTGTTPTNHARLFQWSAPDSTGGTRTITITPASGTLNYSGRVTVLRGSTGVGAKANTNVAQTVSLARQGDNSAIILNINDWSAGVVGSPVWTPGGATVNSQQGTNSTYIYGRWDDGLTASTASYGISSPSYTTPGIAVLEMLGTDIVSTPTVNGSASLSAQSTLTVSASVIVLATSSPTAQSTLTSNSLVSVLATSTLSAQSTLVVAGTRGQLGVAALSGLSTLTVAGTRVLLGVAALSSDSTLNATGTITSSGISVALSSQSTLTAAGVVTRFGATVLSAQSTLVSSGLVIKFGASGLSGQSTVTVGVLNTVLASIPMSSQSTMIADGTIGALPIRADLSAITSLNVTAGLTRLGTVQLSAASNLAANARQGFFANVTMNDDSSFTVAGTVIKLGAAVLNVQSNMVVSGFIPAVITGTVVISSTATLTVAGQANPPWVFTLIEFSSVQATFTEGGSPKTSLFEGDSRPSLFIEGG
jgi:hypothetical protein